MYKINDYVIYNHNVCKIKELKNINSIKYYIMTPIDDASLTITTPVDNKMGYLKDLISIEQANEIINEIPNIEPLSNIDEKNLEYTYKQLINNENRLDLVKVIKTSYLRNNHRIQNKKKISDKDQKYFELAEKYLYNELSVALNMSYDEIKEYITKKVESKNE